MSNILGTLKAQASDWEELVEIPEPIKDEERFDFQVDADLKD